MWIREDDDCPEAFASVSQAAFRVAVERIDASTDTGMSCRLGEH